MLLRAIREGVSSACVRGSSCDNGTVYSKDVLLGPLWCSLTLYLCLLLLVMDSDVKVSLQIFSCDTLDFCHSSTLPSHRFFFFFSPPVFVSK